MDKVAVISDIHGNMQALEAALDDIRQRGIDQIYNLGDLVGKGPNSDLVIDRCREVCQVIVRGNWDDLIPQEQDNPIPGASWYREQVGAERLAYLSALPNVHDFWLSGKRVRLYHASHLSVYERIHAWSPYDTHLSMFENTPFTGFDHQAPDIVGYGDIHNAYMMTLDQKVLFNPGSLGNPLDLTLASYAILSGTIDSQTPATLSIDFVRLPYDVEATIEEAYRLNIPDVDAYAIELRTGVYRGRQKKIDES